MTLPTLIFETLHGSRAYNLHRKDSDVDLKGIFVGPPLWYFGFRGGPEQTALTDDHVRFEIRKFFKLGAAANPTVFEMLWGAPNLYQTIAPSGERLIEAREELLAIRDGALSYEALIEQCEARAEAIHRAALKSFLPDAPDEEALDELCMAIVEETLKC